MTNTSHPINITQSKGIWREHEIDIVLEVSPGMTTVLNINREEAVTLRDKLNHYLGEDNE